MTVLASPRLTLRPMTANDFADLCRMWSDPVFVRGIGMPTLTPETVWLRLLRDIGHWQVLGYGNWAACLDGLFIGSVGLFDYRRDMEPKLDVAEIGWGLLPEFHGQGYAGEAVTAALHHADTALAMKETCCIISPANKRSIALAERCGFARASEGVYKEARTLVLRRPNGVDLGQDAH